MDKEKVIKIENHLNKIKSHIYKMGSNARMKPFITELQLLEREVISLDLLLLGRDSVGRPRRKVTIVSNNND